MQDKIFGHFCLAKFLFFSLISFCHQGIGDMEFYMPHLLYWCTTGRSAFGQNVSIFFGACARVFIVFVQVYLLCFIFEVFLL